MWADEQKAYSKGKGKDLSSRRLLVLSIQWVSSTRSKTLDTVFPIMPPVAKQELLETPIRSGGFTSLNIVTCHCYCPLAGCGQ